MRYEDNRKYRGNRLIVPVFAGEEGGMIAVSQVNGGDSTIRAVE